MDSKKECNYCFEKISKDATYCEFCQSNLASEEKAPVKKSGKIIEETKCTCQACGHVWYFGKYDQMENVGNAMSNVGKSMMCCGGCWPALLIPDKKVVNLGKCPKCNSSAIKKEQVSYEV